MVEKIFYFITVPMVYLAVVWCIIWSIVKIAAIAKAPRKPPTLRIFRENEDREVPGSTAGAIRDTLTMPELRRNKPLFWAFLVVFHVSVVLLFLAHIDLLPQVNIMSADSEHMIGNGAVGVLLTLCIVYFLFRRFRSPLRELSVGGDFLLLFLLFCLFISGDVISWANSWTESGFVMTKQDFGAYLNGLVTFSFADPTDVLSGGHYPVLVTHVLLANLFLIALPFSKIMHVFFAVPMNVMRRG